MEHPHEQHDCQEYEFAYNVSIDAKGNLRVFDVKGKPIEAREARGPLDAKKIIRVQTMSIIEVEGSHYLAIIVGGTLYQVPLPD